jgi:hypothetical protein
VYPPPRSLSSNAEIKSLEEYKKLWRQSIDDPKKFWGDLAEREFFWSKKWSDEFTRFVPVVFLFHACGDGQKMDAGPALEHIGRLKKEGRWRARERERKRVRFGNC